ncbi:STAS domain-containing protein [Phytohabitans sp. ZYX-F-186]|uniref:STAS domain-containing protein n=1 Tax=Phytohabitans maris TaxID=3071409 RepID=A0ABU0ZER9_9ACTN|nr:STAS domain-containing protein [Phytohabitans sp. ZYX-F-186]MDQ7905533.1 STAS domain-containing protein [Phytohabitans sp. ZYX-F-186]
MQAHGDAVHLIVAGDLDHSTRDAFDDAVRAVLTGHPGSIVLDLTAVPFVSSEGAAGLVETSHRSAAIHCRLTIMPSRTVERRLDLLGLTQVLNLSPATPPAAPTPRGRPPTRPGPTPPAPPRPAPTDQRHHSVG